MNKTIKIISAIMLVMLLCFTCTSVFAAGTTGTSGDASSLIPEPNTGGSGVQEISNIGATIAGIVQAAGMSVAVIILIYIGIKYILGSAEDHANYKKSMIPYIVGAVLLFIASFLVKVIYNFATGMTSGS